MTKRDVEGAVIVEDVDTKHFGMMKTPSELPPDLKKSKISPHKS